jgi:hypothetical protein
VPPVSWKYGRHSNHIGKSHCFNGFRVALNMLTPAFWSPAEPAWDFEVTPLLFSKTMGSGDWLATAVPPVITSEPANEIQTGACPKRPRSAYYAWSGSQNGNLCAGINWHEAENARVLRERGSNPLGLECCVRIAHHAGRAAPPVLT